MLKEVQVQQDSELMDFEKAIRLNNDLVVLYDAISETELLTEEIRCLRDEIAGMVEKKLNELQKSKIIL